MILGLMTMTPWKEEDYYYMAIDEVIMLEEFYDRGYKEYENYNTCLKDIYENPPISEYLDPPKDNLITLCPGCHGRTHYKRKYWTNYFNKRLDNE